MKRGRNHLRHINKMLIVCLILFMSVISVQAESRAPTYEQTAINMFKAHEESMTQDLLDFEVASNLNRQMLLSEIEALTADKTKTSREHVQKIIIEYKQEYLNTINTEVVHMKNHMLEKYEVEKNALIEEEITADIETFLDDILFE